MKTLLKNRLLLFALTGGLGLVSTQPLAAQTFTTLHGFTNGTDGADPYGIPNGVVLSGNTLYGTTTYGGAAHYGAIFAININGTGFTNLYSFSAVDPATGTNGDGGEPNGLLLAGGTLYGTTFLGGGSGNGTVFALSTNGFVFTNLHNFTAMTTAAGTNGDGAAPVAGLVLSGNMLYGTASLGGSAGSGTVFALGTNGSGFTNLHNFTATNSFSGVNADGAHPYAGLVLSGSTLYGTAVYGGAGGYGAIFSLSTNGGFSTLYSFSVINYNGANSDGAFPNGLILSGNTLFGTANGGGSGAVGSVFALNALNSSFTNLHSFTALDANTGVNSDGAYPVAGLVLAGNNLYGTGPSGGTAGNGSIFAANVNGTNFATLYDFTATNSLGINQDGADPQAGLIFASGTLYGTAYSGGRAGFGTVFSLSLSPQLTLTPAGTNVILTWPTNLPGLNLQSAKDLFPPVIWSAVSPAPVIINGQNTVTNHVAGGTLFFRLSQ